MQVDFIIKANELCDALRIGLEQQQESLEGLVDSLTEYQNWLLEQVKVERDAVRNTTNVKSNKTVRKIPVEVR